MSNANVDRPDLPVPLRPKTGRNARLRQRLADKKLLIAPGSYDCITARLVERAGFEATYITGSGVSLSALGAPDVGLMSFHEVLDRVKRVADSIEIPLIADVDTGYGGPLNIARTVVEMERAGVSAIQLEDQAWPKRCGHEPDRKLVSAEEMCARIDAATDARRDASFLIVARTDARSDMGIDAAIERGHMFVEHGADAVFVESPESAEEMALIAKSIAAPTVANMVEGGRTPLLPAKTLEEMEFSLAIYPNTLTRLFAKAGAEMMNCLFRDGETAAMRDRMLDHSELWDLFDNKTWIEKELAHSVPGS